MGTSSVASAGFVELSHWSGGKAKLRDSRSIHSKMPAFTSLKIVPVHRPWENMAFHMYIVKYITIDFTYFISILYFSPFWEGL